MKSQLHMDCYPSHGSSLYIIETDDQVIKKNISNIEDKYIKQRDKLLHSTYNLVDKSQIQC